MTTIDTDEIELDDEVENDGYPYSIIPDWVILAQITDLALRVYGLLRAYGNKATGGRSAFPSQEKLAAICGLAKTQTVSAAIAELEGIGAVTRRRVPSPRGQRTIYRTYLEPRVDVGYRGPRMTSELGDIAELATLRARRTRGRRTTLVPEPPDAQAIPELPELPEPIAPDVRSAGDQELRISGEPDAPPAAPGLAQADRQERPADAPAERPRLGWPYDDPLPGGLFDPPETDGRAPS